MAMMDASNLHSLTPLSRDFYDRDTRQIARDLLGKVLIHNDGNTFQAGRIVETEAYLGKGDLAAHTARGPTPRTRVMFGPPGHAYVYLIYGIHHCMNAVTGPEGQGTAVLLRALEPIVGLPDNTHGPGRLTRAMGITRDDYGTDLCGRRLYIVDPGGNADFGIRTSARIGVDYAGEWASKPLRFCLEGSRYLSGK